MLDWYRLTDHIFADYPIIYLARSKRFPELQLQWDAKDCDLNLRDFTCNICQTCTERYGKYLIKDYQGLAKLFADLTLPKCDWSTIPKRPSIIGHIDKWFAHLTKLRVSNPEAVIDEIAILTTAIQRANEIMSVETAKKSPMLWACNYIRMPDNMSIERLACCIFEIAPFVFWGSYASHTNYLHHSNDIFGGLSHDN
jgi:hypothetical protein